MKKKVIAEQCVWHEFFWGGGNNQQQWQQNPSICGFFSMNRGQRRDGLGCVSSQWDTEARLWVQVVYLGGGKHRQGNRKVRQGKKESNAKCISEQVWFWAFGSQGSWGSLGGRGTHLKVVSSGQEVRKLALFPASPVRVWHHFSFWLAWRSFRGFHLAISVIMAFIC